MFIQRLTLKKLLSFNDATVELGQLNVLIGPNAVGKSNLIEVIGLLQAAPTSLAAAILRGGGVRQWLWLGDAVPSPIASIAGARMHVVINEPDMGQCNLADMGVTFR
jgi:predicted ATPase